MMSLNQVSVEARLSIRADTHDAVHVSCATVLVYSCMCEHQHQTCTLLTTHLVVYDVGGHKHTDREKGRQSKHGGHDTRAPRSMPPCCRPHTHLMRKGGTLLCNVPLHLPVMLHSTDGTQFVCLAESLIPDVANRCHVHQISPK